MRKISKKLITMFLLVCMALAAVGCGAAKKQTATCTIEQNGAKVQMDLEAEGDKIVKLTQTSTVPLDGITDEIMEAVDQEIEAAKERFEGIDGVTYSSDKTDTELKEVIVINTDKETLKAVTEKGLLPVEGNTDSLSLEATKKSLEKNGWTVK